MEREKRKIGYLNSFLDAFSESGIDNTSIKKLAKAAQMNEASIYQYFENKDEIILECVNLFFRRIKEELFPALMDESKSLEMRIRILLNYSSEMAGRNKFMVQVLTSPSYGRMCRPAVKNFIRDLNKLAEQLSWQESMPLNLMVPIVYLIFSSIISGEIFSDRNVLSFQISLLVRLLRKESLFIPEGPDEEEVQIPELEEIVQERG